MGLANSPMGKHYKSSNPKSLEQRAKTSASAMVSKEAYPDIWKQLYEITLVRMLLIEEIRGNRKLSAA